MGWAASTRYVDVDAAHVVGAPADRAKSGSLRRELRISQHLRPGADPLIAAIHSALDGRRPRSPARSGPALAPVRRSGPGAAPAGDRGVQPGRVLRAARDARAR